MSRKKTGCRNCMTAKQVVKNGVTTFEAPEKIEDLEEVKYTYNYAEASNYADNKQWSYVNILDTKSQTFLCCTSS